MNKTVPIAFNLMPAQWITLARYFEVDGFSNINEALNALQNYRFVMPDPNKPVEHAENITESELNGAVNLFCILTDEFAYLKPTDSAMQKAQLLGKINRSGTG